MKRFLAFLNHNRLIVIGLIACIAIALFLHVHHPETPCFGSDEAAWEYNAYSIGQTGKDEYGIPLPIRFKSFGENKSPTVAYLVAPFIKVFGLSQANARMPTAIMGILAPIVFFFLLFELFGSKKIGLIGAFLSGSSFWLQSLSRIIHEGFVLIILSAISLIFLLKLFKKFSFLSLFIFSLLNGIILFTYHIGKAIAPVFVIWLTAHLFINRKVFPAKKIILILMIAIVPLIIFTVTELTNPTNRVNTLLFTNNPGFTLSINEMRRENNSRILNNKLTQGILVFTRQYLSYFSPDFLAVNGDENPRFGYKGMSPLTPVEYVFAFIGFYYLYKNRARHRYLLTTILLISPITAALTWQDHSITRSLYMTIPIIAATAYGFYHAALSIKHFRFRIFFICVIVLIHLFFAFFTWDFYFNHYPKRPLVIRANQCGYNELGAYIKSNYDKFSKFYITRQYGQPYIFILNALQYPPAKYQSQANLTPFDQYGFGQVDKFDKFIFSPDMKPDEKDAVMIGFPNDFTSKPYKFDASRIKKITIYGEEIFWIYENAK